MADEPVTDETQNAEADDSAEDIEAQEALAELVTAEPAESDDDESPQEDDSDDVFDASRARQKIKKANAEARRQRERAKAAEEKVAGLEPAQREAALQRVARRLRLPDNEDSDYFLSRLQGDDVDALAQDAERLLTLMAPKEPRVPAPNPAQGSSASGPPPELTPAEKAAQREAEGDWRGAREVKTDILLGLRDQQ